MDVLLVNVGGCLDTDPETERVLSAKGHRLEHARFDVAKPGTIREILSEKPKDFRPDAILCWSIDYTGVPPDIEEAEARTIVQINDFHLAYSVLRPHLRRFDTIWTDQLGVAILRQGGFESFIDSPLYAYAARDIDFELPEKDLDVVFVGGLNHAVHQERSLWLRRLARLGRRRKVLIAGSIFGPEYLRTLARGKILFNHCVRHEMNMRCFEGPVVGSLTLIERENLEAPRYFPDGEAAVYYGVDDFEEKIEHYLAHPEERRRIAENARRIALDLKRRQVLLLLEQIEGLPPVDRRRRRWADPSPERRLVAETRNAIYAFRPEVEARCEESLKEALAVRPSDAEALGSLAFTRLVSAGRLEGTAKVQAIRSALDCLRQARAGNPRHLPTLLSLGNLCSDLRSDAEAREAFEACREAALREDLREEDLEGPCYPVLFEYFRMARERILLNRIGDPPACRREQRLLFRLRACEALGTLALRAERPEEAMARFAEAFECSEKLEDPLPYLFLHLAQAAWLLGDSEAALAYGERFDQLAPFELGFWEVQVQRFLGARRFGEAVRKAEEYAAVATAFTPAKERLGTFLELLESARVNGTGWAAWERAAAMSREGKLAEAEEAFREAWKRLPGCPPLALDFGGLLLGLSRREEARSFLEFAKTDPACEGEARAMERSATGVS